MSSDAIAVLGTLGGVVVGFGLEKFSEWWKTKKVRKGLGKLFAEEIKSLEEQIETKSAKTLPMPHAPIRSPVFEEYKAMLFNVFPESCATLMVNLYLALPELERNEDEVRERFPDYADKIQDIPPGGKEEGVAKIYGDDFREAKESFEGAKESALAIARKVLTELRKITDC